MQLTITQSNSGPTPKSPAAGVGANALWRGRVPPGVFLILAIICVQLGSALATVLFSTIGAIGTAFVSTFFSAAVVTVLAGIAAERLTVRGAALLAQGQWRLILLFGLAVAVMTLTYYLALETVPLGIVATVTFLGPLGLAVAASRRVVHFLWIAIAAAGVALLTPDIGTHLDPIGLSYAAVAAVAWGAFVPLSKRMGAVFPGQSGLALALWAATAMLLPAAVAERSVFSAGLSDFAGAFAVSLLALVLPTMLEFAALRRMSARTYGILVTLEPAIGALVGVVCLGQPAGTRMLIAVACVMIAAAGVTLSDRNEPR